MSLSHREGQREGHTLTPHYRAFTAHSHFTPIPLQPHSNTYKPLFLCINYPLWGIDLLVYYLVTLGLLYIQCQIDPPQIY